MQTPYYVIHKDKLDGLMQELQVALKTYWPNAIIGYSFKTNALPWLIEYMKKAGCYAETVSKDEYSLAKQLGFGNQIVYNGPVKSKETFLEAVRNGCIVNIDSKREIRWLTEAKMTAKVGIRVNFDLEKYCPDETQCGSEGGRFGFCHENGALHEAISMLKEAGLQIAGLHMHCSSKTRSENIYKAIATVCVEIGKNEQLVPEYIDIGGGFFGGVPGKPGFSNYVSVVAEILKEYYNPSTTKLIVEPGMSLVGAPIDYVTSVVDVKDTTYNRFVLTDGSRTNVDPLMRKSGYTYHVEYTDSERDIVPLQIVSGYTCMENDRLFKMENAPELKESDCIVYRKVGAYTMCLTPLFIEYFPDVYLEENGTYTKIRERWTADKLL